ncbi:MAG: hypothetical protein JKY27_01170 [Magnetovibrio sp.]|nr:hypothetical protein [Magnetovibrio sp.]
MNAMTPPLPTHNIRRHVVILGAGASRACCPNGDAVGKNLPVIADFIDTLKLRPKLETAGVFVDGEDFEALYSRLMTSGKYPVLVKDLEDEVFNYFTELRLPKEPTIYDHLVLSLRSKDLIASFNWDPFLIQAMGRCSLIAEPPHCLHLHGNVATGYCFQHERPSIGDRGENCRQCAEPFVDSQLLYPVAQKNYTADPLIAFAWKFVQASLKDCFLLTIFGYGAPATDVEAVNLMKEGWGDVNDRVMEETEIIDIRSDEDLRSTWDSFIHSHHYQTHNTFYDSMLGLLPRRSVEMMFRQLVEAEFIEHFPLPKDANWEELRDWVRPFVEQEKIAANASGA